MNNDKKDYMLSVVIVTRNEEENIESCINSVLEAIKDIKNVEILLVDSASTDNTIEIAKKYPVKIIQLKPSWPLSSHAGRYIGSLHARGHYIQFIDGDMTLDKNWFINSIPILKKHAHIAGVVGIPTQEPYDNYLAKQFTNFFKKWSNNTKEGEIDTFGGAILFKRDALMESGSWNPYMVVEGEAELAIRVVNTGYNFYALLQPMTHHFGVKRVEMIDVIRQIFRCAIGQGQILRYSLKNRSIFRYCICRYKFFLLISIWLAIAIVSVIFLITLDSFIVFYLWIAGTFFILSYISIKKRSVKDGIWHFLDQLIKFPLILRGFLKTPKDPSAYPTEVQIKK